MNETIWHIGVPGEEMSYRKYLIAQALCGACAYSSSEMSAEYAAGFAIRAADEVIRRLAAEETSS